MKRIIALLLCLVMTVSLLAACGGGEKKSGSNDNKGDANAQNVTLTIGIPKSSLVTDYYDNVYTKWLEEKTGYKLEFQFFAAAANDYKTQLSTMVAGELELPDILMGFSLGEDLYERYGRDGVFVDLSEYFNDREKSERWWERFELTDEYSQTNNWRRMQAADGSGAIYAFPEIQESMIDIMNYQVWINQAWLDAVGKEMPTNPDELYDVLKAFKTGDPNGNGLADEIPLVGTASALSGHTLNWLINMFIYADKDIWFNVDENGQLYSPYREDAYRDALKYIRKLYSEGLMSPLTLTATANDLKQMVCPASGGSQIAGVVCGHITLCFEQDHDGLLNYEALPMWGNCIFKENAHNFTTFVTRDCENLDAAWNLLMWMSTEESAIIQRYGEEGESWDWAPEGTFSVMSTEERPHAAQIRLYKDTWGTIGNDNWRNVEATVLLNAEGEGNQAVAEEEEEVRQHKYDLFNQALANYYDQIENYNPSEELVCPLLVWPEEYKEEVPYARADCQSYINKSRTDFITGVKDINSDKDWQEYLDQMDSLGYDQWLFYSQAIYEDTIAGE